jgi:hypothetical protein
VVVVDVGLAEVGLAEVGLAEAVWKWNQEQL